MSGRISQQRGRISGSGRQGRSRDRNYSTNSSEAPRSQQIEWSKEMTSQDATVNSVLLLFTTHGQKFSVRNVATAAHRVAKIGRKQSHRLKQDNRINALATACLNSVKDFESQHLANVAWAFAIIGIEAPALFNAIADAALMKLDDFTPQNLANTVWAFATTSVEAPALFTVIADVALTKLDGFTPQNLVNTAWAFATASVKAPALFNAIADAALMKLDGFTPQALANTAWAFATASVEAPTLFNAIADAALTKLDRFIAQDIVNTAWAFATASVEAPVLFNAIADAALTKLDGFTPHNLANTAWAFATASFEAPALFNAIADAALKKPEKFKPQELANTVWAFACIAWSSLDFFVALISSVSIEHQASFSSKELSQLYLVSLHMQIDFPDQSFPLAHMHSQLLTAFKCQKPRPSQLQRDVAAALNRIAWNHSFEYETPEGFSLDMAQPETKCAIEVDGPSHYLNNNGKRPTENGRTKFKSRVLRKLGWTIVHIPYFEWCPLLDERAEDTYLLTKLESLMSSRESSRGSRNETWVQAASASRIKFF